MNPTIQQHNDFLSHITIAGVELEHNDFVIIINGENKGIKGSVVNIIELGEDPIFTIELESGFDVQEKQSNVSKISF